MKTPRKELFKILGHRNGIYKVKRLSDERQGYSTALVNQVPGTVSELRNHHISFQGPHYAELHGKFHD